VTQLVQDMVTENKIHGFSLQLQKEQTYRSITFGSSEQEDATKRPLLIVEYEEK